MTWLLYQSGTRHLLATVISLQAKGLKTYCIFSTKVCMTCVLSVLCFVYPFFPPCNDCGTAETNPHKFRYLVF